MSLQTYDVMAFWYFFRDPFSIGIPPVPSHIHDVLLLLTYQSDSFDLSIVKHLHADGLYLLALVNSDLLELPSPSG